MITQEIKDIVIKDGNDWTPKEWKVIERYVKKHGRSKLKEVRRGLRNDG